MCGVVLRPCVDADAEAVETLRIAGWRTAYRGIVADGFLDALPVDVERRRDWIRRDRPGVVEVVATVDEAIVGWIVAGPCRDEDRPGDDQGEVYACYAHPDRWRSGVGGALLRHGVERLRVARRTDITLWVLEGNAAARAFYAAHGWRPDGRRQLLDLGGPVAEVRYRLVG